MPTKTGSLLPADEGDFTGEKEVEGETEPSLFKATEVEVPAPSAKEPNVKMTKEQFEEIALGGNEQEFGVGS